METTASAIGFRFLLLTKGSGSVRAKPSHFARQREYSARSAATLRAGAQLNVKSAKGVWGKTRVFPHKQHIKSNCTYPPKQSGGLFRKHTTPLNYSLSTNQKEAARAASFIRSIVLHICHSAIGVQNIIRDLPLRSPRIHRELLNMPVRLVLREVQVVSWYDNENSYTSQMVRTIKYFAELK